MSKWPDIWNPHSQAVYDWYNRHFGGDMKIKGTLVTDIDPHEYRFTFGKYKGEYYTDVREVDPHYIQWLDANVDHFCLPADERENIESMINELEGYYDTGRELY